MDRKCGLVAKPPYFGSEFYDYKVNFNITMMAFVDVIYKFMYVNVGTSGRASDGGVC